MKKKKIKTILIIGGTGFLGYHLCKFFLKKKWKVISLSLNFPNKLRKIKNVKYLYGDISKTNQIEILNTMKIDYIINCGGYVDHKKKKQTYNAHVIGCKNLVKIFKKKEIKNFIQIGSSAEYGTIKSPHLENIKGRPRGSYGAFKYSATKFLKNLSFFFPYVILRPYQVYGPYQDNNRLIPFIINSCLQNKKFPCTIGTQLRDFLYIDDFVNSVFNCLDNKRCLREIINIGFGKPTQIKKIIIKIQKFINLGCPEFGKIIMKNYEQKEVYPSIKKAKNLIKWTPKISLERGLIKTIKFYKSLK